MIDKAETEPDLLTKKQTAARIGVSERTLDRWALDGEGPPRRRVGGRCYYVRTKLEAWLEEL